MALATSVCYTLEDLGWIHEHLRCLHSQGLARLSSTTSFPNVLQACQGGLLSAGREGGHFSPGISAGPCHVQLEGHWWPGAGQPVGLLQLPESWRTMLSAKAQPVLCLKSLFSSQVNWNLQTFPAARKRGWCRQKMMLAGRLLGAVSGR